MPITLPPTTRRSFVAGSIGVIGGMHLVPYATAESSDNPSPLDQSHIALLADTHIHDDPNAIDHGTRWPGSPVETHEDVNHADNLKQVVREILAQDPRPAHALVNGDCARSEGTVDENREFKRLIEPLREAGITVLLTIGNHDNRENLWQVMPELKREAIGRHVGVVELSDAYLVLLDSDRGVVGKEQFEWLEQTLETLEKKPVLCFEHYNPYLRSGARPLRGVNDGETLLKMLTEHKNVKSLSFGHTHQWDIDQWIDVHMINQPSVGATFGKDDPMGWVDMKLTETGTILELRCIDEKHPQHLERHELTWRRG